jgi:hypothetical protein
VLTLANRHLCLDVLDPVADRARLGPRFCWGGFIWQVHDAAAGPLLTGPEWPSPSPVPFNGQGLPESFRHRTRDGRPLTWQGDRGVALGAGELAADAAGDVTVSAPCVWRIDPAGDSLTFTTRHTVAGFAYEISRRLELAERTLRSVTFLANRSDRRLTLEWFAHPFFALRDGLARTDLPAGTALAANPAFALEGRTLVQRRRFADIRDGHMVFLRLPLGAPLAARLEHPSLTHVDFATDFAPAECPVWGNSVTFSIEPYLALDLAPGEVRTWSLLYRFGQPRAGTVRTLREPPAPSGT